MTIADGISAPTPVGMPTAPTIWRRLQARAGRAILAGILPISLIAIWQLSGKNGALFGGALPTPDRVWSAWYNWAFGTPAFGLNPYVGTWLQNVVFSAQRVAQGFLLAMVVGIPIGIAIGWSRLVASVVDPTIQWLRPIPITAWLPISIAIFGIRDFGAIFLFTIGAFYPIVINTTQGARDVDKNWVRAALMMGASRFATLRRVVLPAALPSMFTGFRIGLGIAWTAVIVAEMVAVKSGLGYVLRGAGEKAFVSSADISEFETKRSDTQSIEIYNTAVDVANEAIAAAKKTDNLDDLRHLLWRRARPGTHDGSTLCIAWFGVRGTGRQARIWLWLCRHQAARRCRRPVVCEGDFLHGAQVLDRRAFGDESD